MTTFNVIKNVQEEFDLILSSDFSSTTYATGINDSISVVVDRPSFTTERTVAINSSVGIAVAEPTLTGGSASPSSDTYNSATADCDIAVGLTSSFDSTRTWLYVGSYSDSGLGYKAWIPFVVNMPKDQVVISAILTMIVRNTHDAELAKFKIGCENTSGISVVAPTNYDALNMRTMTSNYTSASVGYYTSGTTLTWDIKGAVQEMLNKANWVIGNTLAVLITNNNSTPNAQKSFFSFDSTSAGNRPTLTINI